MSALTTWGGTARTADLDGPVHWVDFGGTGPRIVLVHGLGGSHLNWCLLAPLLVGHARVAAVDLVGFGLTHPHGRSTGVRANADLLVRFLHEVVGAPAVLVGNSMGGMVSILAAARHRAAVSGLVLVDPSVPGGLGDRIDPLVAAMFAGYATPVLGTRLLARRRATLTPQQAVQATLDLCCVDPSKVPADLKAASEALVSERAAVSGLDAAFLDAARSLLKVNAMAPAYWRAMASIPAPVLLIHGERDRLVPVRAARRAVRRNPWWQLETLPGVGHVPQLEAPDTVAELMLGWLARHPHVAAAAA
jgi:pimeloyl-ACP methyl ester carboxylesterase